MKSDNFFEKINNKLRNTVLSRLLVTYIIIMLVMLAAQSLLMGGIYQQEYYTDRVNSLLKEASDLAKTAMDGSGVLFNQGVYEVAQRQNAEIWIVNYDGAIASMQPDSTGADGAPYFKIVNLDTPDTNEFNICITRVMHGDQIKQENYFPDQLGTGMLTVAVPILSRNVPIGAVFMHTKLQTMDAAIGRMYRHIVASAAVAMILGILLILLMSSRISRPLVQMNDIARHIAKGDFGKRADVKTKDEIGQLAKSFNEMAEELKKQEDLRSGFVANVSHELRSPMTSIHGFAQGMLDGTIPPVDHEKYLEVIVGETRRLNKLIRELLDLSQIESGKFPLNMQVFDINEMISRVLITFEEKIESKNQEIEVDFKQDKSMVLADPDRIQQVVINLLDNAVKFTPERGRIRIWTHGSSDKTLIGIEDNGPGIPDEDQAYVWERFYKVDKSHTGKKGTGLGLSIVKKIIDQHGERITLQSQPGSGSTFVFSLKKPDNKDIKGE